MKKYVHSAVELPSQCGIVSVLSCSRPKPLNSSSKGCRVVASWWTRDAMRNLKLCRMKLTGERERAYYQCMHIHNIRTCVVSYMHTVPVSVCLFCGEIR